MRRQQTYKLNKSTVNNSVLPFCNTLAPYDGHTSADVGRLSSVNTNANTVNVYPVGKGSCLLYKLDDGVQEELMLPMHEILTELEGTDELEEFLSEVDITAANCLLMKEW